MNRETIEKAAEDIVMKLPYAARHKCLKKNVLLMDAFKVGANWRINSVWHDTERELPECGRHVVNEDWFDFIAEDEKDLKRIINKYPFRLWAYVSDLLPDRKEARP